MSLDFNPSQQRCLEALGYTLYALAGSGRESATSPARSSNPEATAAEPRDAKLLTAVLRVARTQIGANDPHAWLSERGVDSIASLRRDPALKRALWATIRRESRTP
jgi:hypothetical protein